MPAPHKKQQLIKLDLDSILFEKRKRNVPDRLILTNKFEKNFKEFTENEN